MNYLKENWRELCIVSIAVFVIGTIMICTWKYSNYALYGKITTLESHLTETAEAVESLNAHDLILATDLKTLSGNVDDLYIRLKKFQYQADVLAESMRQK